MCRLGVFNFFFFLSQLLCSHFISCENESGQPNEGTRVQRQCGEEMGMSGMER